MASLPGTPTMTHLWGQMNAPDASAIATCACVVEALSPIATTCCHVVFLSPSSSSKKTHEQRARATTLRPKPNLLATALS